MTPILSLLAIILFGCGHLLSNLRSALKTSPKMRWHLLWSFQDPKPRKKHWQHNLILFKCNNICFVDYHKGWNKSYLCKLYFTLSSQFPQSSFSFSKFMFMMSWSLVSGVLAWCKVMTKISSLVKQLPFSAQGTRDQPSLAARLHRPAKASTCLGMPRQSAKAGFYIHLDLENNVK